MAFGRGFAAISHDRKACWRRFRQAACRQKGEALMGRLFGILASILKISALWRRSSTAILSRADRAGPPVTDPVFGGGRSGVGCWTR
jgi:hypothetical protein